jgi:DEAD/DEAH box helicase domain-containing protein
MGVTMSNNAADISGNFDDEVYMFIYDKYIGGLGYSEKAFDIIAQIIDNAIKMVGGCKCEDGCAACIGDYKLNKAMVLWGLKNLLSEIEAPKDIKLIEYAPRASMKKAFQFSELQHRWKEFCSYLRENGEAFAAFLSSIPEAYVENNVLVLVTDNAFYKDWIMEKTNHKSLMNIISFYTDAPAGIKLEIRLKEPSGDKRDIINKLQRRYEDLLE